MTIRPILSHQQTQRRSTEDDQTSPAMPISLYHPTRRLCTHEPATYSTSRFFNVDLRARQAHGTFKSILEHHRAVFSLIVTINKTGSTGKLKGLSLRGWKRLPLTLVVFQAPQLGTAGWGYDGPLLLLKPQELSETGSRLQFLSSFFSFPFFLDLF